MKLRETILEGTIQAFNKKGLKFTMDDIAALLGISKKTIYTVFQDKNTLVSEMVDYCFDSIKESEQKVLSDTSLDTVGKIRAILGVLPEGYKDIDFRQLYLLKDKYPKIYKKVEKQLEAGQNVVFDVDVVGGCNIKKFYGEQALSLFIQPPGIEELRNRLVGRGTDAPEVIESRIAKAEFELSFADKFDVVIVNDELEKAKAETLKVIQDFIAK